MEGFAFLTFVAVIVFASFLYGLVKAYIEQRAKVQEQRLRVLEEAVKSGKLDADVLRGLAATLRPEGIAGSVRTVIAFIAWIGLFTGISLLVSSIFTNPYVAQDLAISGGIVFMASLALLSFPLANRELKRRVDATM